MKRQSIFIILIFVLTTIVSYCLLTLEAASKEESGWFPFVLSERLDPDSPANIGKLVLDPPAGKHGFVKVKNGHFYFEDGTRAKFWGTNLCFDACFPSKKQAELMAERLAFFGFNAVRLHHMDFFFDPKGIFEDVCPAYKHPQLKRTGFLSKKQLDKLDYLIFQLKKQGIYVDINLLVSRRFTEGDGVKDAEKLGMTAKPVSMFDPKLIELQKKYAKDLLTHYNPYTELRYCNDPVVALVEITNENTMFKLKSKSIPEYYQKQLDVLWTSWLNNNQTQEKSKDNFYRYLEKKYFQEMISFLKKEINVKAPITGSTFPAALPQDLFDFMDIHVYWDHPHFPNKPWDRNDFRIHNKSMLKDKNLGIIGNILKKQKVMNYESRTMAKPLTITEWNHCYPNQYAYETPVLIAAKAVENDWDALFQFTFANGWKIGPVFDNIQGYFDLIANAQQLILCSAGSLIYQNVNDLKIDISDGLFKIDSSIIKGMFGFIKDKTCIFGSITLSSRQNGSVILYSPKNKPLQNSNRIILVTISEIKNADSAWWRNKFYWGNPPTLIKSLAVDIEIETTNKLKVHELDNKGNRGKEISVKYTDRGALFSTKNATSLYFEIISQ